MAGTNINIWEVKPNDMFTDIFEAHIFDNKNLFEFGF